MSLLGSILAWFVGTSAVVYPPVEETEARPIKTDRQRPMVSDAAMAASLVRGEPTVFTWPNHPPGVGPSEQDRTALPALAMDSNDGLMAVQGWAAQSVLSSFITEGLTFLGYAYLSELAQRPEYRAICDTIGTEMTRKWIKLTSTRDDTENDKAASEKAAKRIKELEAELKRLNVRDLFCRAAQQDGYFGRGHIYVDTGDVDNPQEELKSIGDGWDAASKAKISKKHPIVALRTIEALWCYPTEYNSNDPRRDNWYRPEQWYIQAARVHSSRLLTFIGREVPDLLKPTYSFGGLSLSQLAKPYVDNWLKTRQSVNDIISAYSVFVLKTDLSESMQGDGQEMFRRADFFNNVRDNRGLVMLDKNTEEMDNVSAPLSGLDLLQGQAQEHMAAVSHIPVVKLLGIQPSGLNASSEGELRSFYDYIHAYQEHLFRDKLHRLMGLLMLSLWGETDDTIDFEFEPLWAMDEKQVAELRKQEADTDVAYIDAGVLHPEESRKRLADDPDTPYRGLDVEDVPDMLEEEAEGLAVPGARPDKDIIDAEAGVEPTGAQDDWNESDHPHAPAGSSKGGQFTSTGGGGGAKAPSSGKEMFAENKSLPSPAALKINNAATDDLGYEAVDADKPDEWKYKKGDSTLTMNAEGVWTLASPGHMTKTGTNANGLKALVLGQLVNGGNWQSYGVVNYNAQQHTAPVPAAEAAAVSSHKATLQTIAKARPQPTGAQSEAIDAYKDGQYGAMNESLRHQGNWTPKTEQLHGWLDKAELPVDATLWRGVRGDYAKHLRSIIEEGMVFRDRGFISTSTDDSFSKNWKGSSSGGLIMQIDVKKGQKGAAIRHHTQGDSESEVLLQADSRLKVISFNFQTGHVHCELIQPSNMERPKVKAAPAPAPAPKPSTGFIDTVNNPVAPAAKPEPTLAQQHVANMKKLYKKNPEVAKIKMIVDKNPKKPGTKAHSDFAKLMESSTAAEFIAKMPDKASAYAELDYSLSKGFVDFKGD